MNLFILPASCVLFILLIFHRLEPKYSKIVKKLNSETIPLEGTHLGINYKSETDSIFRVSFSWDGIVYDPSGKIMRCNESDSRFPDKGIRMLMSLIRSE